MGSWIAAQMKLHLACSCDNRLFLGMWTKRGRQTILVCLAFFCSAPLEAQEIAVAPTVDPQTGALQRVSVRAVGACPSALAVARELNPLLSKWEITAEDQHVDACARLDDLGASFRIAIQGEIREVENSPADCRERARVAAVVIAMQLETPSGSAAPPADALETEPPSEEVAEPVEALQNESEHPTRWEMQADLLVAGGIDAIAPFGLGPRVAVQWMASRWLLRLGAGVLFFSRIEAGELLLSYARFPIDFAVGRALTVGDFRLSPSLALAFDPFRVEAPELDGAQGTARLDVGARLGFQVSRASWPLRPTLELQASWFPRDFELYVSPQGEIARTPNFWWGLSLGGSFTLGEQ